ncbi:SNF related kinase b [Amia ocellicauda]|uniref:SNF related kinase b n=1 Tax=Amia ocellicauda TaxID=2972642 RepID=UPI0034638FCB|nr:SNRK kinase [Amia calva]
MAASKSGYEGKIAGLYDLDRTLGKGHFAVVKLARHVFTGQLVAVKVIDKTKLDSLAAGHLLQEVRCMKLVQHPNVVRLYEVIDTQTKLYLILELGDGGDMYDYIMRHEGGVSEAQAKVHFAQIVRAISYCHRLHVVHRDLKPENVVFFRQQGTVKLTDFGFSNHFQPGTMLMTSCGSLAYSAPEILLGEEYDAPAVDIWSLGVILYMLVCGQPPFQEANDSETLIMIMDCRYTVPVHISEECRDLISRMLQRDPGKRASLEEIESHVWLQGVDPSPASRSAVPLTSYKSLSQEEHDIIIQAMTCGNIADQDTIQEALEADRYNHITATYFLLAERILREKQEHPGQAPRAECSWTEPRQHQRPLSEPLDLGIGRSRESSCEVQGLHTSENLPSSLGPCKASPENIEKAEPDGRKPLVLHAGREEGSFFSDHGVGQQMGLLLRSSGAGELPSTKNVRALQQICEEDEEEEEVVPFTPYTNECRNIHWIVDNQSNQLGGNKPVEPSPVLKVANQSPSCQEMIETKQCVQGTQAGGKELQSCGHLEDKQEVEYLGKKAVSSNGKGKRQIICCQDMDIHKGKQCPHDEEHLKESRPQESKPLDRDDSGGVISMKCQKKQLTEGSSDVGDLKDRRQCEAGKVLVNAQGTTEGKKEEIPCEQESVNKETGTAKQDQSPENPVLQTSEDENHTKLKRSSEGIKEMLQETRERAEGAVDCHLVNVQCCQGDPRMTSMDPSEEPVKEHNNNLPRLEPKVPSAASSPRTLIKNHCVDMGNDAEMRISSLAKDNLSMLALEREPWGPQEGEGEDSSHFERSRRVLGEKETDFCSRGGVCLTSNYEMGPEPMIRVDPAKTKNVNLRDRLLQFPLCEKALSFKIKPTSKESLMPFGQFNCCHVL